MQALLYPRRRMDAYAVRRHITGKITAHRRWYWFEGILFLIAGWLMVIVPQTTVLAVEICLAVLLLLVGFMRIVNMIRLSYWRWWHGFSGLLFVSVGGAMLVWPQQGLEALVFLVGCLLLAEGILETLIALAFRPLFYWGWLLFAGIANIILGVLTLTVFPIAGVIYLAWIIGLSMGLYGLSLLMILRKNKEIPIRSIGYGG